MLSSRLYSKLIPRLENRIFNLKLSSDAPGSCEEPYSNNDIVAPRIRNRNPMNLEKMAIGRKPEGFQFEQSTRKFWNNLTLDISNQHTTAEVTHWTGRQVARASTREWPIRKQLYNLTDAAAVQVVAKIISQRCLETGVSEVHLMVDNAERTKDKMQKFISIIEESGISLSEPDTFTPPNPHADEFYNMPAKKIKPWTVLE